MIPDIEAIPPWVNAKVITPPTTKNAKALLNKIDTSTWEYFSVGGENGLFDIEPCKCSNASELLESGNEIDYVGAKKNDGGFMDRVCENAELTTKGNCIVFIVMVKDRWAIQTIERMTLLAQQHCQ